MKSYICKDAVFNIIPKNVEGATKAKVVEVMIDSFMLELMTDEQYKENELLELYSITPQGLLYFETFVNEINGNKIKVLYPVSHKFLQRREYSRIDFQRHILLKHDGYEIEAKIMDIGAGGMKISSSEQLTFSSDYEVNIEIDKNIFITCLFQPIRIEVDNYLGYTVSGRFKLLKNLDRISLVQFCFKKQMENRNK